MRGFRRLCSNPLRLNHIVSLFHSKMMFVVVFALLIASLSLVQGHADVEYGIVFDAGSSGTRIYVYSYPHRHSDKDVPMVLNVLDPITQEGANKKTKPGVADLSTDLPAIDGHLAPLIEYAKTIVPEDLVAETEVYFLCTAGMRLLPTADQNKVLTKVREVLSGSGFAFKDDWARVISGQEEAIFGWITVNYLSGVFSNSSAKSVGALDMGGASTQITFSHAVHATPPIKTPSANTADQANGIKLLAFNGAFYELYAHSFLSFGQDQAREKLDKTTSQCFFSDAADAGRTANCKTDILGILEKDAVCSNEPCSMKGVHQPALDTAMNFVAFSAYRYTEQDVAKTLAANHTLSAYQALADDLCTKSWTEVQAAFPDTPEEYLENYCFSSQYHLAVLQTGYGFAPDTKKILFTNEIAETDLGWNLGAMIYHANLLPIELPAEDPMSAGVAKLKVSNLLSLAILGAIMATTMIMI